jgi:mono/diheme cytochrome c family protein
MRIALFLTLLLLACGCEKLARNMYDSARQRPLQQSETRDGVAFPPGGNATPSLVSAERNEGVLAATSSGRAGMAAMERRIVAEKAQSYPRPVTMALLERGRERFEIYCVPCHSPLGDGDGMVVRRGFPKPTSYHVDRLREAPDRQFYDVITQGYGIMYAYGDRVGPEDRWAIVAYIRALQRSQDAGNAKAADSR